MDCCCSCNDKKENIKKLEFGFIDWIKTFISWIRSYHKTYDIEPGLYFVPMLLKEIAGHKDVNWQKVDEFLPYGGIRIEDNVVVKAKDSINLSR